MSPTTDTTQWSAIPANIIERVIWLLRISEDTFARVVHIGVTFHCMGNFITLVIKNDHSKFSTRGKLNPNNDRNDRTKKSKISNRIDFVRLRF